MEQPVARLRAYEGPYRAEELEGLVQPLVALYNVTFEPVGEGGLPFGLDLHLIIPALLGVGGLLKTGIIEGAAKKLGEKFVDLVFRHRQDVSRQGSSEVTLTISTLQPEGYTSDYLRRDFGIRATIRIPVEGLNRPAELRSTIANACDLMEEAHARLWHAIEHRQVPVKMRLAHFDENPPNEYRIVRCRGDLALSSPQYEADLFAADDPRWHLVDS